MPPRHSEYSDTIENTRNILVIDIIALILSQFKVHVYMAYIYDSGVFSGTDLFPIAHLHLLVKRGICNRCQRPMPSKLYAI